MKTYLLKTLNFAIYGVNSQYRNIVESKLVNNLNYALQIFKIIWNKLPIVLQAAVVVCSVLYLFILFLYGYIIIGGLMGLVPVLYFASTSDVITPEPLPKKGKWYMGGFANRSLREQRTALAEAGLNPDLPRGAPLSSNPQQYKPSSLGQGILTSAYLDGIESMGQVGNEDVKTNQSLASRHIIYNLQKKTNFITRNLGFFLNPTGKLALASSKEMYNMGKTVNPQQIYGVLKMRDDAIDASIKTGTFNYFNHLLKGDQPEVVKLYDKSKFLHQQPKDFWTPGLMAHWHYCKNYEPNQIRNYLNNPGGYVEHMKSKFELILHMEAYNQNKSTYSQIDINNPLTQQRNLYADNRAASVAQQTALAKDSFDKKALREKYKTRNH